MRAGEPESRSVSGVAGRRPGGTGELWMGRTAPVRGNSTWKGRPGGGILEKIREGGLALS